MPTETILLALVLISGFYMAWNIGANDVANAMGTSVGSGALRLHQAVLIAAVLEFSGAFFFGSHVSSTVQQGIVDPDVFTQSPQMLVYGMLASLIAAGAWLQIASYFGWPVSTTHSIIGAVVGFGAIVGGVEAVYWDNVAFIVTSWILSPLIGGLLGYLTFTFFRRKIFYSSDPVAATKRLIPVLVFILLAILSQIVFSKTLKRWEFSPIDSLLVAATFAGMGALISYLLVRRVPASAEAAMGPPALDPKGVTALEKAKKHLKRLEAASSGETQRRAGMILEEVRGMSHALKQRIEPAHDSSEFVSVERMFGYLQIISASLMAFAHGANDVANAIGPLSAAVAVLMTGVIPVEATIPAWALVLGGVGIIIGLATWGWRVIETIGRKITELTPTRGFAAEFSAATTILVATRLGMPISTTHTLVGAVIGVGLARGIEALNLATTRDIVVSWLVTVPAGATIAVIIFYGLQGIFG